MEEMAGSPEKKLLCSVHARTHMRTCAHIQTQTTIFIVYTVDCRFLHVCLYTLVIFFH